MRPSLPVARQPNHAAIIFNFREQIRDCSCLVRQNQIRPDVSQRLEDKSSQVHPRVWQLQTFVVDPSIAVIQQVDVNCARDVFLMIALSA
jgi:hypothetical protein